MAKSTAGTSARLCHRLVFGVTGSVGALWTAQFILFLRTEGYVQEIAVVMTDHATKFVGRSAMRAVSGREVLMDLFDPEAPFGIGHVEITAGASALVVMPATANVIGKAAAGVADDAVTSSILAAECPVIFVPNMNPTMWRHAIVRRNVRTLKKAGYQIIPPVEGVQVATLQRRPGGMPSFDVIIKAIRAVLKRTQG